MKHRITVDLNEKGINLLNKEKIELTIRFKYVADGEKICNTVYSIVPEDLVENINVPLITLNDAEIGDYVILYTHKDRYSWAGNYVRIENIKDNKIYVTGHTFPFDLGGVEISRKKRNVPYIKKVYYEQYDRLKKNEERQQLIEKINNFVFNAEKVSQLSNDELIEIISIFNRYN